MVDRKNISSGAPWESIVGYSRAVRIDNHVWVAGTTATDESGNVVGKGDPAAQARYALQKIGRALAEAVRAKGKRLTTIYVSQSDPDYYFSLGPIQKVFPEARVIGHHRLAPVCQEADRLRVRPDAQRGRPHPTCRFLASVRHIRGKCCAASARYGARLCETHARAGGG